MSDKDEGMPERFIFTPQGLVSLSERPNWRGPLLVGANDYDTLRAQLEEARMENRQLRRLIERGTPVSEYERRQSERAGTAEARAEAAESRLSELQKVVAAKQAKIDALMLEYCPDEMTPEQVEEWGKHQVAVPESELPADPRTREDGNE